MANWIITDSVNLRHPMVNTQGTAAEVLMLPLDNKAHTWQVVVRDGYTDADLTGKSCYAYFARNDNAKVLVNGTITGNVCSVTLDSTCYAIPGFLRAVMIMSDTDQTVAICEKTFRVNPALPGQTVDPGETIPSYDDLLAEIGAMRLATSEVIAATNAARTATTDANTAAQTANTNASAAQTAANNANQATTAANIAAQNANSAAQNANSVLDGLGSSLVEEKNAYHLRLAKIQYTNFGDSYWGTTPEEKARNIAKFDIHVSGSINSDTLPIISRAKEINPNLKICAYVSVASGRPSFDKDSNDLSKPWGWYTFRRDGSWDNEYASQFFPVYGVNLTVPFNKWQILQQIEEFAHVGGHRTGERELVDTYTWIDENGVSHTDNKYIDKWTGGTSYDGIFWDDVGFDHIIDEGTFFETDNSTAPIDSVKRQGFASRRDKYICINSFAHDRGMFVIPNSINKEDLYDPAVSNENPDGLGSSLTENDYVFVESFLSMIGTANSVNWRNEVNRVKTYMDDWYDIVKAKVIVEDYGYPMMDKETLDQFTTYAMATCVALGVHYYSITNVDNSLYVPNVIDLPVPIDESDRKAHLTRPASDMVKYSYAENTLSVIRNSELTRGEVTKYSILNGIKILLNGNRLYNAFISAAESDAGLSDKLKELKATIDESISDTKQSASIYNRLMIDDWSVDALEYTKLITDEAFTAFAQGSQNRFASDENVDVTYDVSERTITWTKNATDGNGMQSVPLNIRINREHYGHTIEVGYAIKTTGTGVGAWLDMRLDGSLWYEDGANPAKNTSALYPSREDMSVRRRTLIDYGDKDFVPLEFIATWNSNCLSATIENFYVIDVDEFDMDVSKTEYTNLMPAYEPNIQLGASRSFIMLPGSNSKSFTIDFENGAQPYNNGDGAGWWLDKSIFTPGHTYELGIKDVERNSGSYVMKLNIRIGLGDDDYIRNVVEFHDKYNSKIFPDIKTYNRRFTIPEDAVLTNPLLEFASYYGDYNNQEGTKPRNIVIHDWYLVDCDEENVIIRGVTPAQTSIRICRVTEESLSNDIQNETLINNALYLTDTGKIYLTDVNKSLVKSSNSDFSPIVCWGDSLTYGYSDPIDNNNFDGYSKSRFDHRQRICYPSALAEMVGRPVINLGVSGETCQTIMARQGADPMLTPAFTIPADTTPVEIGTFGNLYNGGLRTVSGRNATILGYGNSGINPCYINGVKGYLTATGQRSDRSGIKYYFQRETAGSDVSVPDGTVIQTYAMRNLRKGVAIIWMGYNGQFDGPQDMVNKINAMIKYGNYSDYLVLTCNEMYADDSYGYYKEAWGNRFLYLRPLLGRIGVQEAGLWSDGTLKDNGIAQELDYDGVHFNSYGCKAIASFVFKRLLENGSL